MTTSINAKRFPHGEGLSLPSRMTKGSSGCDICAAITEPVELQPGARVLVPTGLSLEIPEGYEVQVRPRSGLAIKYGVTVLNSPGTIDSDYRGEVKIILINLGEKSFVINRGDRIAQLVPMHIASSVNFTESAELTDSHRGAGGFGHTGV